MPLTGVPEHDIPVEIKAGKPQKQAVAIALSEQRRRKGKDAIRPVPVNDKWGIAQEHRYFQRREELEAQGMTKRQAHEKAVKEIEAKDSLRPVSVGKDASGPPTQIMRKGMKGTLVKEGGNAFYRYEPAGKSSNPPMQIMRKGMKGTLVKEGGNVFYRYEPVGRDADPQSQYWSPLMDPSVPSFLAKEYFRLFNAYAQLNSRAKATKAKADKDAADAAFQKANAAFERCRQAAINASKGKDSLRPVSVGRDTKGGKHYNASIVPVNGGAAQEMRYFKRRRELEAQGMTKLEAHRKAVKEIEGGSTKDSLRPVSVGRDAGNEYEVTVENIGQVYSGPSHIEANAIYRDYVVQSRGKQGRAASSKVFLSKNNKIVREYDPS